MVNGRVVSRLKLSSVLSSPSTFSWLAIKLLDWSRQVEEPILIRSWRSNYLQFLTQSFSISVKVLSPEREVFL